MLSTTVVCIVSMLLMVSSAMAQYGRPFQGSVKLSVLLCKFKDAPTPAKGIDYYQDFFTKGLADFCTDVSDKAIDLNGSVVRGWYTLDLMADEGKALKVPTKSTRSALTRPSRTGFATSRQCGRCRYQSQY
jgi:hypothetical protein